MKHIKDYNTFLNEGLKHDAFILLNNIGPSIKIIRDLIWGKKIGEQKLGLLNPLMKITAGLGITISLIYLMMWYHNKQLDKVHPEIQKKLEKYQKLLDSEFSPKEQDNFIRLIASDKKVLNSVIAVLNGNKDPEHLKYIESRFTKTQIEKINKLAAKIDTQEKTNESLNEAEWYELLGLTKSDVSHIKNASDIAKDPKIKAARRKKAMEFHPDRNPGDKKAEDMMKAINVAYDDGKGSNIDGKEPKFNIGQDRENSRRPSSSSYDHWSDEDKKNHWNKSDKFKNYKDDIFDTSFKRKNTKDIRSYRSVIEFSFDIIHDMIKSYIVDTILTGLVSMVFASADQGKIQKLKRIDRNYESNLDVLEFLFDNIFNDSQKKELNHYFENDLEYINYIQRLKRNMKPADRKRLSDVITEHIAEKMPPKLFKKYNAFMQIGKDNNLFTAGSVTPHSLSRTYGADYTVDLLKQHLLPQIKFLN